MVQTTAEEMARVIAAQQVRLHQLQEQNDNLRGRIAELEAWRENDGLQVTLLAKEVERLREASLSHLEDTVSDAT